MAKDWGGGTWGSYLLNDGLFFCPVPKVACAEWKRTMRWIGGLPDWRRIQHSRYKQGNILMFTFQDQLTNIPNKETKIERVLWNALEQGYRYNDVVSDPGIVKVISWLNYSKEKGIYFYCDFGVYRGDILSY